MYLFYSVCINVVLLHLSMAMVIFLEKIEGKYLHVFKTNENDLATTKSVLFCPFTRSIKKKKV